MSHTERCPVCGGNGQVPNGFYGTTNVQGGVLLWVSGGTAPETCRTCNGMGMVVIDDKGEIKR